MAIRDNTSIRASADILRDRLPSSWELKSTSPPRGSRAAADGYVRITAPGRVSGVLALLLKRGLEPRQVSAIAGDEDGGTDDATRLIAAPYLSPAVRERLEDAGLAYLDLTGNVRLQMTKPGLYIRTQGADVNPNRKERPSRTLRGAKAGRVVRALVDSADPPGVRALAEGASVDPGYASRIIALLDREALIRREGRGRIASVDWQRLLKRWAQDAPLESRGQQVTCLEPRGLGALDTKLKKLSLRYAVTGSLAAGRFAPLAPPRLAVVYTDDVEEAIENLGLRRTDAGANVMLIESADEGVFARGGKRDGVQYVAPSQAAADLLSSTGRGPAEAEELIAWMAEHEEAWRG